MTKVNNEICAVISSRLLTGDLLTIVIIFSTYRLWLKSLCLSCTKQKYLPVNPLKKKKRTLQIEENTRTKRQKH